MRLEGKVAIVTGATKGIGRVTAAALAAEGAKVVVAGRTEARGEEVAASIRAAGGEAVFVRADVGDEASVQEVVRRAVEEFGSLTTLVNNAAPTHLLQDGRFVADVEVEVWDGVLRVALTGAMLMAKHSLAHLVAAGGGTIVNISSDAAVRASTGLAAYSAAKAGLNALTRSIALEYAPQGVRANSIQVGQVLPPQSLGFVTSDPVLGPKLEAAHRLRLGRREDIAAGVVFLASDESGFVTGATMVIDGGASVMTNLLASELFPGA